MRSPGRRLLFFLRVSPGSLREPHRVLVAVLGEVAPREAIRWTVGPGSARAAARLRAFSLRDQRRSS